MVYVTIKYRKRGRIKKAICRGDDKKERSEEEGKERRKRRRAHTRRRERARMTLGRGGGARSATSISGVGGRGRFVRVVGKGGWFGGKENRWQAIFLQEFLLAGPPCWADGWG